MSARRTPPLDPLSAALAVALADHTSDFVGVVDPSGRALFLNRSVRGANPDDVEGKSLEEFLTPDRAGRIRGMLEEARATGLPVVEDAVRIDALDGSERWFTEKCVPFQENDGSVRFLLVRTERTRLRRAEEELEASERRYRTLFESNPDPVVVVDVTTLGIVAANPAAVRLYGFSEPGLRERGWLALFPDEEHDELKSKYGSSPAGERRMTVRQRRRDGTVIVAEIVDNPIVFAGVSARIAVVRDLTERELLEAKLRHAQKMEAMGVFAGGIAHDFNNLFAVISGCAQGVRETAPTGATAGEDLDTLDDAVARGANLTKKLMLFCRRFVLHPSPIDLVDVVDDLRALLRRSLGSDVELTVTHEAKSAPILGDRTELDQLVLNLVLNAGQASSSRIRVRTAVVEIDASFATRLPRARPGRYVELTVEDDGIGMDEATLSRIFEPFFTTKTKGTGLGLAVVHGVVERHDGHLRADSRPGAGTTIAAYLPLAKVAHKNEPAADTLASRAGRRVLFADDDDALRRLTERMLRRLGYQVVTAGDGVEAVRLFERTPDDFDLVLLDVLMPNMKGPAAFARMRAIRPDLGAVFVSGYVGTPSEAGTDGQPLRILHKPFTLDQLDEALRLLS